MRRVCLGRASSNFEDLGFRQVYGVFRHFISVQAVSEGLELGSRQREGLRQVRAERQGEPGGQGFSEGSWGWVTVK